MITKILVILSSAALAACTALSPVYLQNAVDSSTAQDGAQVAVRLTLYILSIIGILVFEACRQLSVSKYQADTVAAFKHRLLRHILRMPPRQYQMEEGQNYITSLNQEVDMLVENYYVQRLELLYSVLVLIGCTAALLSIDPLLAVLILVGAFLPILVSTLQGKRMQKRTNLYTKSLEKLNVMMANLIQGYPTLKTSRAEGRYGRVLEDEVDVTAHKQFGMDATKAGINMLIGTMAYVGEVALVVVSIYLIARGRLTVGALVGALQISQMLAIPTNSIAYEINDMNSVKSIREKFQTYGKIDREGQKRAEPCPEIRRLEFRDVSFRYEEKPILDHLNVTFEAGKKYLILGENGSGKSTLFQLLTKFQSEYQGQIQVNGRDLNTIDDSFYERIGVILQDTFFLNDTLLNNITLYQSWGEDQVRQVLLSLGMGDFLVSHPLDSLYQDTKDNLSGGEKQKLGLARVLLAQKTFLLLDEATSAVDRESSLQIERQLLERPEVTLINIEHKILPELLPLYDEVYELRDGTLHRKPTTEESATH